MGASVQILFRSILLCIVLISCSPVRETSPAKSDQEAGKSPGIWLQLFEGRFEQLDGPDKLLPVQSLPWTVQARIADCAVVGGEVLLAINGYGIASFSFPEFRQPTFRYFYDALIFRTRTITTLIPLEDSVLCHLYFNKLLNTAREEELELQGISLVTLIPSSGNYRFVFSPFQELNSEWESVGFLPVNTHRFYFEWKYTDAVETRFKYTQLDIQEKRESPSGRSEFLKAFHFESIDSAELPKSLKQIFDFSVRILIMDRAATSSSSSSTHPSLTIHFLLRSREKPVWRRFRYGGESELLVTVPLFEEKGTCYALLPYGELVRADRNGALSRFSLPKLPPAFRYTGFLKEGERFVFTWEEVRFYSVGRAGILIVNGAQLDQLSPNL